MSNASRFVEDLDRAHRQRIIKKTVEEEHNSESINRLIENCEGTLKVFCWVIIFMAVLFLIFPALYELWVR